MPSDAQAHLTYLASALGSCLSAQACSVPEAAAIFLGLYEPLPLAPKQRRLCAPQPPGQPDQGPPGSAAFLIPAAEQVSQSDAHPGSLPTVRSSVKVAQSVQDSVASTAQMQGALMDHKPSTLPACSAGQDSATVQAPAEHDSPPHAGGSQQPALHQGGSSSSCGTSDPDSKPGSQTAGGMSHRPAGSFKLVEVHRKQWQAAVDPQQHPFWLSFQDAGLEERFREHYAQQWQLVSLLCSSSGPDASARGGLLVACLYCCPSKRCLPQCSRFYGHLWLSPVGLGHL